MNASYAIEGNLALALPAAQPASDPKPHFVVVPGGKTMEVPVPRGASTPNVRVRYALMFALVLIALVGTVATLALRYESQSSAIASVPYERLEVRPGESLWSIAEDHGISGVSTADVVEAIRQRNDLSAGSLEPGQVLSVPAASSR